MNFNVQTLLTVDELCCVFPNVGHFHTSMMGFQTPIATGLLEVCYPENGIFSAQR